MFIVTPAAAARVLRENPRRTWCYLGTDVAARQRLRGTCGADVPIGAQLTAIALRLKQPFLDWIAALGSQQGQPIAWWASALGSKSPLQSALFFHACYGEALAGWAGAGAPAQVIVIEDPWLWSAALEWFGQSGSTRVVGSLWTRRIAIARLRLGAIRATVAFVAWSVTSMLAALATFGRRWERLDGVLIFSWIEPRGFGPDGRFRDPYTGRLAALLRDHGIPTKRLTPLQVRRSLWAAIGRANEPFIVSAAFIRLADIVRASIASLRIDASHGQGEFRGRSHAMLLDRERRTELAGLAFRQHLLWYRVARRIAAACAGRRMVVVYPFENQPHEKLMCMAWQEVAPDGVLVGYVTAGIPTLLLSFFLGAGERAFQPLPDRIVTNGRASLELLAANGYPMDRLVDGGAWRFESLAGPAGSDDTILARPPVVLVPFPTVAMYARVLLEDLMDAFREPLIDGTTGEAVRLVLTFHVDLPAAEVCRAGDRIPSSMTVSDGAVGTLLPEARLCVFVPPTGSWREALFAGVPVLRYRPDLLDLDPIDSLGGVELPDCSRGNLREAIAAALAAPPLMSAEDRERVLRRVYSPVQEQVWLSFAGPGAAESSSAEHGPR